MGWDEIIQPVKSGEDWLWTPWLHFTMAAKVTPVNAAQEETIALLKNACAITFLLPCRPTFHWTAKPRLVLLKACKFIMLESGRFCLIVYLLENILEEKPVRLCVQLIILHPLAIWWFGQSLFWPSFFFLLAIAVFEMSFFWTVVTMGGGAPR